MLSTFIVVLLMTVANGGKRKDNSVSVPHGSPFVPANVLEGNMSPFNLVLDPILSKFPDDTSVVFIFDHGRSPDSNEGQVF